jgi:hydroxymethylglutaryl-CoA lyase
MNAQEGFSLPKDVTLEDVTLRDGLQNESKLLSVEEKSGIVKGLIAAGVRRIQVGSFVNPEKVPQMANTGGLFRMLPENKGVTYTALVLNETGLEQALDSGVRHLYMAISATETHNLKNNHCTFGEAKARIERMIIRAKHQGHSVRAGIMMAFGCAYEGMVPVERVIDIAKLYSRLEVDIIDLADTAALANPRQIFELVIMIRSETNDTPVSLHLHDTRKMGLPNMLAGLLAGVTLFDTSTGGLGGCPFVPEPAGNIATEEAAFMLEKMGILTGIHIKALYALKHSLEEVLRKNL